MRIFAGIDGGQTATKAVVGDENGAILGRGTAGPADETGQGLQSTRMRDALEGALACALLDAGLARNARMEAVVAGVSGYGGYVRGVEPAFNATRVTLLHDAPIARAGALEGEPGIVVIAGTGSVAYGVAKNGESVTVGGWGFVFGDEGSAFGIACDALRAAMFDEDRGDRKSEMLKAARRAFGVTGLRTVVRAFYSGDIARGEIAAFAKVVIAMAERGEEIALDSVLDAGVSCANLAKVCARRLNVRAPKVAFVGGLLKNEFFSHVIDLSLEKIVPRFKRVEPAHEPVIGALLLARRSAENGGRDASAGNAVEV